MWKDNSDFLPGNDQEREARANEKVPGLPAGFPVLGFRQVLVPARFPGLA